MTETLRLPEGSLDGHWLVDMSAVDIKDLIDHRPGRIIRMKHKDAVKYVPQSMDDYSFVAGMTSDAA